jgi:hypothetical protein
MTSKFIVLVGPALLGLFAAGLVRFGAGAAGAAGAALAVTPVSGTLRLAPVVPLPNDNVLTR